MDSTARGLLIALVVLVLIALGFSVLMGGMMGPGMMGPSGVRGGWGWGLGMGVGGLAMLAYLSALIVGVVLLARSVGGGRGHRRHTPLDILKRRYAAGEITREQYEQMRKDIEA